MVKAETGFDVTGAVGARAAVLAAAAVVARGLRRELAAKDLVQKWREALGGTQTLARLVGCSTDEIELKRKEGIAADLMKFEQAAKASPIMDCSTRERALSAVRYAMHVYQSVGHEAQVTADARAEAQIQLDELCTFMVREGKVSRDEAGSIVIGALERAGLPPASLETIVPIAEQPVVNLVARILAKEKRAMTSKELIAQLKEMGRSLNVVNPAAAIRGAVLARKNSPVISAGRGLWKLNEAASVAAPNRPRVK